MNSIKASDAILILNLAISLANCDQPHEDVKVLRKFVEPELATAQGMLFASLLDQAVTMAETLQAERKLR